MVLTGHHSRDPLFQWHFSSILFLFSFSPFSPSFPHKAIWFPLIPSKTQAFFWKIAWNCPNYLRRYPNVQPPSHPLSQLLLLLPLWCGICCCFCTACLPGDYEVAFFSWLIKLGSPMENFTLHVTLEVNVSLQVFEETMDLLLPSALMWVVLMERSERVFDNLSGDLSSVWYLFYFM